LIKELKLPAESQALEINEFLDEIYIGDIVTFLKISIKIYF